MADIYRDRKYINFGADGINPLGVIRSLGQEGVKTIVIRDKESGHFASINTSVYADKIYFADSNEEALQILLENYSNEQLKPVLFFTYEGHVDFCDSHYDELKDKFIFYNTGKKGGLSRLNNKEIQCQLASECGMQVPQYEILAKGDLPKQVPYPIITKTLTSTESGWKRDMIICHNEKELQEAYSKILAERIMIEEYIDANNEFDLKGFSINGGEQIYFTYQKTWHYKDPQKRWLMYFAPCENEDIKQKLTAMIQKANYSGIFDAEFLQKQNGDLVFLEVNWRTGMYNYNHTVAGVNLPFLWAKSTIDGKIDYANIKPTMPTYTAMDEMSFADVLRKPKRLIQWLKALHKADVLFYYHYKDRRPCWIAWKHFFKRKISNIIHHT
ncbi:MAG: ATP-grasp domain-containing protein [Paludibacteraceae bacterium]|nr:ATP-grasp domain-containing protein [Paludibacteraceae bacterium]